MIFPLFGILLIIGIFFIAEGWSSQNQLFIWIGALVLMLTGLENFLNPLEIATAQLVNETGNYLLYSPIDSWIIIPFSRILFWLGLFGLSFPITLTIDKNAEIKNKNKENLTP